MEKVKVYVDESAVKTEIDFHRKAVEHLNSLVNDMRAEGITPTEDIAELIFDAPKFKQIITEQAKEEASKIKFAVWQNIYIDAIQPLCAKIDEWCNKAVGLSSSGSMSAVCLNREYLFATSQGEIKLVDGFEDRIKELHTVSIRKKDADKVKEMAERIMTDLVQFEEYLSTLGNVVHAISPNKGVYHSEGIILINKPLSAGDKRTFSFNPSVLSSLYRKWQ